jgi:hypothetical protein
MSTVSTEEAQAKPSIREKAHAQIDKYFGYIKPKKVGLSGRSALKILSPEGEVIHYRYM